MLDNIPTIIMGFVIFGFLVLVPIACYHDSKNWDVRMKACLQDGMKEYECYSMLRSCRR